MRVIRLNICVPILVSGTSCKHIHKERVTIPTPRAMSLFASGLTSDGHAIVGLADAWKKGDTNMISHILRESHGFDGKVVKHETGRVELQLTPASGEDESVGQQYCVDVLGKFFAKEEQSVPAASAPVSTGAALGSNAVVRILDLVIVSIVLAASVTGKTSREIAKEWLLDIIGEEMGKFVKKCLPLNSGRKIVIHLMAIPEDTLEKEIVPKLTRKGTVERLTEDETKNRVRVEAQMKESKAAMAAAVGDVGQTAGVIDRLASLRGDGGGASKKRRFAERGMEAFSTSHRVAAYSLKEAKETDLVPDERD